MPQLSDPIRVGNRSVRNRIVLPPMETLMSTEEGEPTQEMLDHYMERARAGVGLVVIEHAYVLPEGMVSPNQLGIHTDILVPSIRDLVKEIKSTGATVALQITHGGSVAPSELTGSRPKGPSEVMHPDGTELPSPLTVNEIEVIMEAFVEAADRTARCGLDMVMIHSAHGYLLSQFLSPITNKRDDDFGGDLASRSLMVVTLVERIRKLLKDFPVSVRLGIRDQYPEEVEPDPKYDNGLTLEEGIEVARHLEGKGCDLLDMSGGLCGTEPPGASPGYFLPWSAALKDAIAIPVVATGGITEPQLAKEAIIQGKADMIGIGRAMLKDPAWAAKALG